MVTTYVRCVITILMSIGMLSKSLQKEISDFGMEIIIGKLSILTLQSNLLESIKLHQGKDPCLLKVQLFLREKDKEFKVSMDRILYFKGRICVPNFEFLKKQILSEAHETPYSIHLRASKMYKDLEQNYWWPNMKNEIAEFVSKCLSCQKVKAEHPPPRGELQKIELLK